jgi:hypothetical protein
MWLQMLTWIQLVSYHVATDANMDTASDYHMATYANMDTASELPCGYRC